MKFILKKHVVDVHDPVCIQRVISYSLVEYLNYFFDIKLPYLPIQLVFAQTTQMFFILICFTLPIYTMIKWQYKKYIAFLGILSWYFFEFFKLYYELPEHHLITTIKNVKITGKLDRRTGKYKIFVGKQEVMDKNVGEFIKESDRNFCYGVFEKQVVEIVKEVHFQLKTD